MGLKKLSLQSSYSEYALKDCDSSSEYCSLLKYGGRDIVVYAGSTSEKTSNVFGSSTGSKKFNAVSE